MRTAVLAAVAGLALAVTGASQPASTVTKTVSITATAFTPTSRTIATTDSIKWTNNDTKNHQVVANNGSFVSPTIAPGKTYTHVFNTAGTFNYHDALHPSLTGKIIVKGPPPAVTIGAAVPIIDYGQSTHISGVVSSKQAGETVTVWAQPYGQVSAVQIATLLTGTGGVWDVMVKPTLLTNYQAHWKSTVSAQVGVQLRPDDRLRRGEALGLGQDQGRPLAHRQEGVPAEVHPLPRVGEGAAGRARKRVGEALPARAPGRAPLRRSHLHVAEPDRRRLPRRLQPHGRRQAAPVVLFRIHGAG